MLYLVGRASRAASLPLTLFALKGLSGSHQFLSRETPCPSPCPPSPPPSIPTFPSLLSLSLPLSLSLYLSLYLSLSVLPLHLPSNPRQFSHNWPGCPLYRCLCINVWLGFAYASLFCILYNKCVYLCAGYLCVCCVSFCAKKNGLCRYCMCAFSIPFFSLY